MELSKIIELDKQYFMNTFGDRIPVCFEHGKGINLWDTTGKKYYDFFSGIAVSVLGHSHPILINAIKEQAEKLIHCSNLYYIESQAILAELLVKNSCADKVFFANSGAEANEGAIKLARIYFRKKGLPNKFEIITLENSFHGRTLATLAATGQEKYQINYVPLTPKFSSVPLNDIEKLKNAINPNTCAIMVELIQGESGVNSLTEEYLVAVKNLCNENDILLIFDEVQTGLGRTGNLFAYQHFNVEPDIFTLAKALGGGVPIGALCAKDYVAKAFEVGDHGSTFGGNPLACYAGIAVINTLLNDNLVENAKLMGCLLENKLKLLKSKYNFIKEIRGKGLMIGLEINIETAKEIKDECFNRGYLIGNCGNYVLRLLPPLIVTEHDIDGLMSVLDSVLGKYQ